MLTKKQQIALDLLKSGKNIFVTGPAGSGKSHVIHVFHQWYQKNIFFYTS